MALVPPGQPLLGTGGRIKAARYGSVDPVGEPTQAQKRCRAEALSAEWLQDEDVAEPQVITLLSNGQVRQAVAPHDLAQSEDLPTEVDREERLDARISKRSVPVVVREGNQFPYQHGDAPSEFRARPIVAEMRPSPHQRHAIAKPSNPFDAT